MNEILLQHGFTLYSQSCPCSGAVKRAYRKMVGSDLLEVVTSRSEFILRKNHVKLASGTEADLAQNLNTHV